MSLLASRLVQRVCVCVCSRSRVGRVEGDLRGQPLLLSEAPAGLERKRYLGHYEDLSSDPVVVVVVVVVPHSCPISKLSSFFSLCSIFPQQLFLFPLLNTFTSVFPSSLLYCSQILKEFHYMGGHPPPRQKSRRDAFVGQPLFGTLCMLWEMSQTLKNK